MTTKLSLVACLPLAVLLLAALTFQPSDAAPAGEPKKSSKKETTKDIKHTGGGYAGKPYSDPDPSAYPPPPNYDLPYKGGDKPQGYDEGPSYDGPYGGKEPYGKESYGKEPYGKESYGKEPYGKEPYGKESYGKEPYGKEPYGKEPYGKKPYGKGVKDQEYLPGDDGQYLPDEYQEYPRGEYQEYHGDEYQPDGYPTNTVKYDDAYNVDPKACATGEHY